MEKAYKISLLATEVDLIEDALGLYARMALARDQLPSEARTGNGRLAQSLQTRLRALLLTHSRTVEQEI